MARKTLTTDPGVLVAENHTSLTFRQYGPVLFQDIHRIEKQELTL